MAPVHETCSRNTKRSEGDVNRKSMRRRRRRRRCEGKGWSNTLSTLIRPIKLWDSSAEDADSSSTSSLEVKENHNEKPLREYKVFKKYPSTFYTTFSRHKQKTLKRKQELVDERDRHQVCKKSAWAIVQKNPLVHLNELRPGLRYEIVSKTGPLHAPVFSVAVDVNGFHFEGQGATKKQAKMRAAERALQSFIQFPNPSQTHVTMGNFSSTNVDFTADKLDFTGSAPPLNENCDFLHCNTAKKEIFSSIYNHLRSSSLDFSSSTNQRRQPVRTSLLEHLSPVALLNKLQPGLRYLCQAEKVRGRPMRNFIMVVRLEGRVYEGCGHSKRQAKAQAAAEALQSLYNISLRPERTLMGLQGSRTKHQLPQFFAESIYHLVKEKHSQLTETSSTSLTHHKVLAGIVTTRGFDLRSARVVSLATGTKHLDLDNLRDLGCTLADCHAEVLSRRALVRFLYSQLELLLCNPAEDEEQSIFKANKSPSDVLRLQEGVLFHMFVSSSPCGDARLNCPYETTAMCPSRRFCCHLRVKVNGGEGTLPVTSLRANQKWDGASPCNLPISMSCTDKMAKWSAVGLQGALLSHLVEPIYLHSLTVGTLSHTGHLSRAMAHRLMPVKHLLFPHRQQQLLLGCLSSREIRPAGKAADVSVNWSYGDQTLEEVSTSTGRRAVSGSPSRLCSRSLFSCWLRLQEKLNGPILDPAATTETYSAAKMSAGRYQRAVQQFSSSLQGGGLGTWIRKPPKSFQVQCEKN